MLIQNEADVNIQEKDGVTALILASARGHTDIVKLLKDAGTSVRKAAKE